MACWCFRGSRDLREDPSSPSSPPGPPTPPTSEGSGSLGEHSVTRQPQGHGRQRPPAVHLHLHSPKYSTWHGYASHQQFRLVSPPAGGDVSSGGRTPPFEGGARTKEPPPLATSTPRRARSPQPSPRHSPFTYPEGGGFLQRSQGLPPPSKAAAAAPPRSKKPPSPFKGRGALAVTEGGAPRRRHRRPQGRRAPRSKPPPESITSSQSVRHSTKTSVPSASLPREDTVSDISVVSPMPALDVSYTAYLTPDVLTPTVIPPSPETPPDVPYGWPGDGWTLEEQEEEDLYVQHNPLYWLVSPRGLARPTPGQYAFPGASYMRPSPPAPPSRPAPGSPVPQHYLPEGRDRAVVASRSTLSPISEVSHPSPVLTYVEVHAEERQQRPDTRVLRREQSYFASVETQAQEYLHYTLVERRTQERLRHPRPEVQIQERPRRSREEVHVPEGRFYPRSKSQVRERPRLPRSERPDLVRPAWYAQEHPRHPCLEPRAQERPRRPRSEASIPGSQRQPGGRGFRRHRLNGHRKRSNIKIFDLCDDARFVYIVHALIQILVCIEQVQYMTSSLWTILLYVSNG